MDGLREVTTMRYIGDMWPRSIIDYNKYSIYLDLCKCRDKFLKDIRETRYCDWLIDKRLLEGGGLGKTIYICPARAEGKYFAQLELYKKLIGDDREIKVVKAYEKPVNIQKLKEVVMDWDLHPINFWRGESMYDLFNDFEPEPEWIVLPDGSLRWRGASLVCRKD